MSWLNTLDHLIAQGSQARLQESALALDRLLALPVADRWRCLRGRDASLRRLTADDHDIFCQSLNVHAALRSGAPPSDGESALAAALSGAAGDPAGSRSADTGAGPSGTGPGRTDDGAPVLPSASDPEVVLASLPGPGAERLTAILLAMLIGGGAVLTGLQVTGVWDDRAAVQATAPGAETGPSDPVGGLAEADAIERTGISIPVPPPLSIRDVLAASKILELRQAIDAGRPFERELAAVARALPAFPDGPWVGPVFARYAASGIATRVSLADRLPAVLADIDGRWDRSVLGVATRLARRLTGLSNREAQAWQMAKRLLARTEHAMRAGKLGVAVAVLETLPADHSGPAQPWLEDARARLMVDARFDDFLGPLPAVDSLPPGFDGSGRLG